MRRNRNNREMKRNHNMDQKTAVLAFAALAMMAGGMGQAAVLFNYAGPFLAHETGNGANLTGMAVTRDNTATDSLYFKYTVTNPASNSGTENYYAGMQMWEGGAERLGVGNAWSAHAYSYFGSGDGDLNSATPEPSQTYQLVRSTDTTTIVFKVDYMNGVDDNITVWLNPDLGQSEAAQNAALTTTFTANASFNELRLREGGNGAGWNFSEVAIASSGTDTGFFVPEPSAVLLCGFGTLSLLRRRRR